MHTGALVEDSVIFDNCDIGRRAKTAEGNPRQECPGSGRRIIGYDLEKDALYHHVTESGIVVVEGHRSTVEVSSIDT